MMQKVFDYIGQNGLLSEGDTVVVGVSGGADSVCLLHLLKEYSAAHPLKLIAAHVHHGLRESADRDEEYVQKLCTGWGILLKVCHIDAGKIAKEQGISVEEAGRIKRYEFFRRVQEENHGTKIAVAHHRDDLCETMLFQLFRGSGIGGLRGIKPMSGDIIRPLLCVSKEEIEGYLRQKGIAWCEDETNKDLTYSRNRIRNQIMPVAKEICTKAPEHMAQSAERIRELEEYLDSECDRVEGTVTKTTVSKDGKILEILLCNELFALPKALGGELVLRALCKTAGRKRDIGSAQIEAVFDLYGAPKGKERVFLYDIRAKKDYDGIHITKMNAKEKSGSGEEISGRLDMKVISDPDLSAVPTDEYRKWFDYDLIGEQICLRKPLEGDYLYVTKDGRKLLKDYCKDAKIPDKERENLLIVAKDSLVLWVVGRRMGEYGKVCDQTKRVLELSVTETDKDE